MSPLRELENGGNLSIPRRPWAIEIGGPAGAGKTTLLKALADRHPIITADARLRRVRDLPTIAGNMFSFLPTYLKLFRGTRWFTWTETRSMTYLKSWLRDLSLRPNGSSAITVFDHGPIFRLVILREFGPDVTRSPQFQSWWADVLHEWSAALNLVVWLDAPDELLIQRIRERPRWHRFKATTEEEAFRFMLDYRKSCEELISRLTANGGPKLLHFDTSVYSTDAVADEILRHFGVLDNANMSPLRPLAQPSAVAAPLGI